MGAQSSASLAELLARYHLLGLQRGTVRSFDDIAKAHRVSIRKHHPDRGGSEDLASALNAARDWFRQESNDNPDFWMEESEAASGGYKFGFPLQGIQPASRDEPISHRFVREYMEREELIFDCTGNIMPHGGYKTTKDGYTPEESIKQDVMDPEKLHSDLLDHLDIIKGRGGQIDKISPASIKRAISQVAREDAKERRAKILVPLYQPLASHEKIIATEQWLLFARACFDVPAPLAEAILKKIIHQVKLKCVHGRVGDHLMVVFQSEVQGVGKSTAINYFLEPLGELRSGSTLLRDLADKSNTTLFDRPVVVIDDMERLDRSLVEILKSVVSSDTIERRRFFTQKMVQQPQRATFIGSCNRPLHELIEDDTGHRRFVSLPFKGGTDRAERVGIWNVVNQIDFSLLWRSVSEDDPDPIIPFLGKLNEKSESQTPFGMLKSWLVALDFSHPDMKAIERKRGYLAADLRDIFLDHFPRVKMDVRDFNAAMSRCVRDGIGPFLGQDKVKEGKTYRRDKREY